MKSEEGQSLARRGHAAHIELSIQALSGGQRVDFRTDQSGAQPWAHVAQAASVETFGHGDGSIHFSVYGRGEPVLLIHGLGCSGADWALQTAALEGQFRVIVPDLPGCGASLAPRSGYSIVGFASTLWALLDHLGVSCANVVGFSLGGAVALEMALQRTWRVPRLALINTLASYRDDWRKSWARCRRVVI